MSHQHTLPNRWRPRVDGAGCFEMSLLDTRLIRSRGPDGEPVISLGCHGPITPRPPPSRVKRRARRWLSRIAANPLGWHRRAPKLAGAPWATGVDCLILLSAPLCCSGHRVDARYSQQRKAHIAVREHARKLTSSHCAWPVVPTALRPQRHRDLTRSNIVEMSGPK